MAEENREPLDNNHDSVPEKQGDFDVAKFKEDGKSKLRGNLDNLKVTHSGTEYLPALRNRLQKYQERLAQEQFRLATSLGGTRPSIEASALVDLYTEHISEIQALLDSNVQVIETGESSWRKQVGKTIDSAVDAFGRAKNDFQKKVADSDPIGQINRSTARAKMSQASQKIRQSLQTAWTTIKGKFQKNTNDTASDTTGAIPEQYNNDPDSTKPEVDLDAIRDSVQELQSNRDQLESDIQRLQGTVNELQAWVNKTEESSERDMAIRALPDRQQELQQLLEAKTKLDKAIEELQGYIPVTPVVVSVTRVDSSAPLTPTNEQQTRVESRDIKKSVAEYTELAKRLTVLNHRLRGYFDVTNAEPPQYVADTNPLDRAVYDEARQVWEKMRAILAFLATLSSIELTKSGIPAYLREEIDAYRARAGQASQQQSAPANPPVPPGGGPVQNANAVPPQPPVPGNATENPTGTVHAPGTMEVDSNGYIVPRKPGTAKPPVSNESVVGNNEILNISFVNLDNVAAQLAYETALDRSKTDSQSQGILSQLKHMAIGAFQEKRYITRARKEQRTSGDLFATRTGAVASGASSAIKVDIAERFADTDDVMRRSGESRSIEQGPFAGEVRAALAECLRQSSGQSPDQVRNICAAFAARLENHAKQEYKMEFVGSNFTLAVEKILKTQRFLNIINTVDGTLESELKNINIITGVARGTTANGLIDPARAAEQVKKMESLRSKAWSLVNSSTLSVALLAIGAASVAGVGTAIPTVALGGVLTSTAIGMGALKGFEKFDDLKEKMKIHKLDLTEGANRFRGTSKDRELVAKNMYGLEKATDLISRMRAGNTDAYVEAWARHSLENSDNMIMFDYSGANKETLGKDLLREIAKFRRSPQYLNDSIAMNNRANTRMNELRAEAEKYEKQQKSSRLKEAWKKFGWSVTTSAVVGTALQEVLALYGPVKDQLVGVLEKTTSGDQVQTLMAKGWDVLQGITGGTDSVTESASAFTGYDAAPDHEFSRGFDNNSYLEDHFKTDPGRTVTIDHYWDNNSVRPFEGNELKLDLGGENGTGIIRNADNVITQVQFDLSNMDVATGSGGKLDIAKLIAEGNGRIKLGFIPDNADFLQGKVENVLFADIDSATGRVTISTEDPRVLGYLGVKDGHVALHTGNLVVGELNGDNFAPIARMESVPGVTPFTEAIPEIGWNPLFVPLPGGREKLNKPVWDERGYQYEPAKPTDPKPKSPDNVPGSTTGKPENMTGNQQNKAESDAIAEKKKTPQYKSGDTVFIKKGDEKTGPYTVRYVFAGTALLEDKNGKPVNSKIEELLPATAALEKGSQVSVKGRNNEVFQVLDQYTDEHGDVVYALVDKDGKLLQGDTVFRPDQLEIPVVQQQSVESVDFTAIDQKISKNIDDMEMSDYYAVLDEFEIPRDTSPENAKQMIQERVHSGVSSSMLKMLGLDLDSKVNSSAESDTGNQPNNTAPAATQSESAPSVTNNSALESQEYYFPTADDEPKEPENWPSDTIDTVKIPESKEDDFPTEADEPKEALPADDTLAYHYAQMRGQDALDFLNPGNN